jgi:DNA-binding CsgD family transcriptional regulator
VIGFDRWCWIGSDPDALVALSGIAEHDYGPGVARALELEYSGSDFAAMDVVARRATPSGSLSAETAGDLAQSPRWDEVLRPVGIGDEAVVACRDAFGCWGWIKAYRDSGDRAFEDADLDLLADVASCLGSVVRRHLMEGRGDRAGEPSTPGVIVLDSDLSPVSRTAGAQAWIDCLPAAGLFAAWGMLPPEVYPLATLARSGATGARALERAADNRWVMIEAALLEDGDEKIAITLRSAGPAETFDLLGRVYELTHREREVVRAIVAGLDTRGISERLFISRHTVQDHLNRSSKRQACTVAASYSQRSTLPPTGNSLVRRPRLICPP